MNVIEKVLCGALDQQSEGTGSAIAIIQSLGMICGSIGMVVVSVKPESLIENLYP